jgi:hypothetical protein
MQHHMHIIQHPIRLMRSAEADTIDSICTRQTSFHAAMSLLACCTSGLYCFGPHNSAWYTQGQRGLFGFTWHHPPYTRHMTYWRHWLTIMHCQE